MKSKIIEFLNILEGYKTRCKSLHWAAPNRGIHKYLDEFLEILQDYQDSLAEGYMGIGGQLSEDTLVGVVINAYDAQEFILRLRTDVASFYEQIPDVVWYKGIASECEAFIQNINKYKYLFSLC